MLEPESMNPLMSSRPKSHLMSHPQRNYHLMSLSMKSVRRSLKMNNSMNEMKNATTMSKNGMSARTKREKSDWKNARTMSKNGMSARTKREKSDWKNARTMSRMNDWKKWMIHDSNSRMRVSFRYFHSSFLQRSHWNSPQRIHLSFRPKNHSSYYLMDDSKNRMRNAKMNDSRNATKYVRTDSYLNENRCCSLRHWNFLGRLSCPGHWSFPDRLNCSGHWSFPDRLNCSGHWSFPDRLNCSGHWSFPDRLNCSGHWSFQMGYLAMDRTRGTRRDNLEKMRRTKEKTRGHKSDFHQNRHCNNSKMGNKS
jgi:hypothetical protein